MKIWAQIKAHRLVALRISALVVVILLLLLIFRWLDTRNAYQIKAAGQVADAWSKFAIGFGAVATGIGGLGLIEEWLKKQSSRDDLRERLIKKWKKLYPLEKINKDFRLIQNREKQGIIYIQDLPDGPKHWVVNPETMEDLGFNYGMVVMVDATPFDQMPPSENINTRQFEV